MFEVSIADCFIFYLLADAGQAKIYARNESKKGEWWLHEKTPNDFLQ